MRKIGTENFREHLFSDVTRAVEKANDAAHAAIAHRHPSHWRSASTAPHNQDLELRIAEDGATSALPFPCRQTNAGEWINVDLGVPLHIQPVEWRAWLQSKSPDPHQSSIFGPEGPAIRRREQWGGCHAGTDAAQGPFRTTPKR